MLLKLTSGNGASERGMMPAAEAERWKEGIYTLMARWRLEPGQLT